MKPAASIDTPANATVGKAGRCVAVNRSASAGAAASSAMARANQKRRMDAAMVFFAVAFMLRTQFRWTPTLAKSASETAINLATEVRSSGERAVGLLATAD